MVRIVPEHAPCAPTHNAGPATDERWWWRWRLLMGDDVSNLVSITTELSIWYVTFEETLKHQNAEDIELEET